MKLFASFVLCSLIGAPAALAAGSRGEAVFHLCAQCHGPQAHGNHEIEAPSIAGLPAWYITAQLEKFRNGQRGKHADDDAGNRMRPLALTLDPEDVAAVAEYVAALPAEKQAPILTGGSVERGKAKFGQCVTCHSANGGGNEAVHAPPLNMANDWYLLRQLENFKKHIRGYDNADSFGLAMAAQTTTLKNERVMKDLLAYIATLDNNSTGGGASAGTTMKVDDIPKFEKGSPELVAKGKELFNTNCAVCHGPGGNGDGAGGASLSPKPRNFHADASAWTHGNTAWSIYYTLAIGSPGTGMASYRTLAPEDRWALTHYVMSFAPGASRHGKNDTDGEKAAKDDIVAANATPKETLPIEFAMKRIAE
jgi:cytochrome c553